MRPGDVFVGNDAYEGGGTHLPDIVLAEPIFVDGAIVAWAVNTAHHADFADRGHAHIYQEGLRIPPIRLYRAGDAAGGRAGADPAELPGAARAAVGSAGADGGQPARRGADGARCARKYGADVVLAAGDALLDYAERKMRAGIAAIPDGTYRFEDCYDDPEVDGELRVSCAHHRCRRRDAAAFRGAGPGPGRDEHGLHRAALDRVLRGEDGGRPDASCPMPGWRGRCTSTARPGSMLNCVHPAAVNGRIGAVPARGRPDPRRAGAGGAGAGDRRLQRLRRGRHASSATGPDGDALGLPRDDRRRLRRAGAARTGWTGCTCT